MRMVTVMVLTLMIAPEAAFFAIAIALALSSNDMMAKFLCIELLFCDYFVNGRKHFSCP